MHPSNAPPASRTRVVHRRRNSGHSYTVVAIDEAGNRSEPTPERVARPSVAPDTMPPPTPSDVRVEAAVARARVTWTQSAIADVAAFEIFRSVAGGSLGVLARSTATLLLDVDLPAATEHCYQIVAIDAVGNRSAPSAASRARTEGTAAAPDEPGLTPELDATAAVLSACGSLSIASGELRTDPSNPLAAGRHRLIVDVQDVSSLGPTDGRCVRSPEDWLQSRVAAPPDTAERGRLRRVRGRFIAPAARRTPGGSLSERSASVVLVGQ